jgi:hypothetical protein
VPARPSGKGTFSEGKAFESGKGRMKRRREVEQVFLRSCTILNFDIRLGRAAFGKSFNIDIGGGGGATL